MNIHYALPINQDPKLPDHVEDVVGDEVPVDIRLAVTAVCWFASEGEFQDLHIALARELQS